MRLASLPRLRSLSRLNPSHHLLLGDQMVNTFQVTQQALHISTPLIQHIIRIPRLREIDNPGWTIDLGIHRLSSNQLADVLLRLVFGEIKQLGEAGHLDTGIVFCDNTDVVLDDALAKVLPALVGFLVGGLARGGIEDIGAAEMGAKELRYFRPAHEFVNGEEFEELGFEGDLAVAGVSDDAVEEVGLFVVVGGKNNVVDDSLENLEC